MTTVKLIEREPTEGMIAAAVTAIRVEAMGPVPSGPETIARVALRAAWEAAPELPPPGAYQIGGVVFEAPALTLMERIERLERQLTRHGLLRDEPGVIKL